MFNQLRVLYFSPTGGTKRIVHRIAAGLSERLQIPALETDLTSPNSRKCTYSFSMKDLVILGTPVYAGRVPNKIMPDLLSCLKGNGAPAIAVNAFGNRNYDGASEELKQILEKTGFVPVGAAAIANRHAFSGRLGAGRPDAEDYAQMEAWLDALASKMKCKKPASLPSVRDAVLAPYYTPLGEDGKPAVFLKAKPLTDLKKCTHCGLCAEKCPMGSIEPNQEEVVSGICIKCQACVRGCPVQAKYFADEEFLSHVRMLEQSFTKRADALYEI